MHAGCHAVHQYINVCCISLLEALAIYTKQFLEVQISQWQKSFQYYGGQKKCILLNLLAGNPWNKIPRKFPFQFDVHQRGLNFGLWVPCTVVVCGIYVGIHVPESKPDHCYCDLPQNVAIVGGQVARSCDNNHCHTNIFLENKLLIKSHCFLHCSLSQAVYLWVLK